jgi:patatin-like phospholipase/acyl hydrolase
MDASPDLRLLSLDGGGVRGLSTLYILKNLLQKVAGPGQPLPKPCDYFDMIGGTSTGGLIAIMLGRLGMSVDECIRHYLELSKEIFIKKRSRLPFNYKLELATQFDARRLEKVIKGFPGAEELLASDEAAAARCKVSVLDPSFDINPSCS